MKRTEDVDYDALFDSLNTGPSDDAVKPEHAAWADLDDDTEDDGADDDEA
jgi:hypothetical protein